MVVSAITPMPVAVSVVVVLSRAVATSVVTATVTMVVVLITALRVATSATSSHALTPAKKVVVVLMPLVATAVMTTAAVTVLNSVRLQPILGTKAIAALPRVKTRVKTVLVKVAVGKSAAVTTATQPVQHHAVPPAPVTSLPVAPNKLAPAISNRKLQVMALQASAAVHAS